MIPDSSGRPEGDLQRPGCHRRVAARVLGILAGADRPRRRALGRSDRCRRKAGPKHRPPSSAARLRALCTAHPPSSPPTP
jgi:hypothetical protein